MSSSETLGEWLAQVGLARLEPTFRDHGIDLDVVPLLTDGELKELGLTLGDRKRVLSAAAMVAESHARVGRLRSERAVSTWSEAERRQLTVMFCDLVGSTAMSARLDPEDMQTIIRAYQGCVGEVISRYEGFIARYMGDGVLVYFGYPQAHEGDAEHAVNAGLALVDAVPKLQTCLEAPLQVRIGIATGTVVVGDVIGEGIAEEQSVIGETPNLAARLQALAEPNTVVISPSTRRITGGTFEYRDLGRVILKGLPEPVSAWQVLARSGVQSRFEAQQTTVTPLVGREQELGLLLDRWALAQDGEGQVVLLSGEAGIGKSRILSALRERLEGQGAQALRFQCSPYYVNTAFWPIIDNLERALKFGRGETPESKLDKLEALMATHYGRPLTDVRFIASILSIPCEERYGALTVTPQKHKDETLRSLVDLAEAAARKQPSIVLYEDVHWADPTSLEVLDLLIERVHSFPLLILLTHRPEFRPLWDAHGHVTGLNLSKLMRAQSRSMVSKLVGNKALPADLVEQILAKTDGMPLFVEELTKSILESSQLKEAADRYEYAGPTHSITIPVTLRDSLMARLDRYVQVKEIAQIGAAIGREFSYELIAAVAPQTKAELDDALERLTASGLAFRRGTPPEATYTFKHALVQDAAYDSLLKTRRQELHRQIAQVIEERSADKTNEPEVLAHHLTAAGLAEAAIPLWRTAGELSLRRMALTEAISHLNKGLELIVTLPSSTERDGHELALRIPLGMAWQALKGWATPEVWSSLHPALALAKSLGHNDALLPILWGLTLNVMTQGRIAEAFQWVKETLETAKVTCDSDLSITGHVLANTYYYFIGNPNEALYHHREVLALYDAERHGHLVKLLNHDPKTRTGAYASICTWMLGYPEQAVRLSHATDEHARRRAHPIDLGFALRMSAELFDFRSEPAEMRKRADECERLGRDNSLPVLWAIIARFARGVALIREVKAVEGIGPLEAGLKYWDASGGGSHGVYLRAVLAEGMALSGDIDRALELIADQIAQIERPDWGERVYYAEILRLKGWMLSLKKDLEGAERNYLASLDWAREQQAKSWELRTSVSLARLWQAQGKREEAFELLAPIYDWFTEGFDTKDLKDAAALLGELAPGTRASAAFCSHAGVGLSS
jgi:class 3 adenylate cyclase/tetratricopeptide (TPR) repeat protein